ncbi:MAG: hypothetical protein RSF86_14705, partial [Angelakisella sp.]
SGPYGGNPMKVQVLSPAPSYCLSVSVGQNLLLMPRERFLFSSLIKRHLKRGGRTAMSGLYS